MVEVTEVAIMVAVITAVDTTATAATVRPFGVITPERSARIGSMRRRSAVITPLARQT